MFRLLFAPPIAVYDPQAFCEPAALQSLPQPPSPLRTLTLQPRLRLAIPRGIYTAQQLGALLPSAQKRPGHRSRQALLCRRRRPHAGRTGLRLTSSIAGARRPVVYAYLSVPCSLLGLQPLLVAVKGMPQWLAACPPTI